MGLFNFLKGEFLEVVHWEDSSQDTMVYKFPMTDKQQIKEGAQLIVRPSQVAIFVYEGQIADVYEPGKYELHTATMPIFTSLSNWKFKFENHFKTDVYFVNMKQFTNQKWGTVNPIMMRDADFGILRLRGFGVYSFRVSDAVTFLKEVFGSNKFFTVDQINEHLKSLIVSSVSDVIAEAKIPAMDLATQYDEIGQLAMARITDRFEIYGLMISDFAVENLSLPESVEKAIDKRTEMGALGDLNQYMKFQTAEAIRDAAQNEGGGFASMGAGMGAGAGIGKVMADAMASPNQAQTQPQAQPHMETVACGKCGAQNRKGAKFCSECGFSFIKKCISCGHEIDPNAKFCMECGASQVVESKCPKCGESIDADAKFCPHCGQSTKA
ncbi:SPFH domain-containing protein [Fusibacter ferrireducens]|uniref:SPFH domain-containing protein n=1 Tax=Fusibacter ferrireducens TaxID=2785058 RepID=A0ABR9ZU69_9FIRM|nr:SPFH domain-containing protein [Fusibacter ferrireducens]MBF4693124.1 SPFH domain-containing protein [Fusibacter ferrireducens]